MIRIKTFILISSSTDLMSGAVNRLHGRWSRFDYVSILFEQRLAGFYMDFNGLPITVTWLMIFVGNQFYWCESCTSVDMLSYLWDRLGKIHRCLHADNFLLGCVQLCLIISTSSTEDRQKKNSSVQVWFDSNDGRMNWPDAVPLICVSHSQSICAR